MRTIVIVMFLVSLCYSNPPENDMFKNKITAHFNLSYIPTSSLEFESTDDSYDIYDNSAFRFSVDYKVSSLVSIGPGFEYMNKHISSIAVFKEDITLTGYYLNCFFNHSLLDSGSSYMVFGVGTGLNVLRESDNENGSGFCFQGIIGFDLALFNSVGVDLLYRYQLSKIYVDDKIYRFDGSVLQAGLNYRFRF